MVVNVLWIRMMLWRRTLVVPFRLSQRDKDNGVYSLFIRTVGIIYWEKCHPCVQQSASPKPTVITGQNTVIPRLTSDPANEFFG